MAKKDFMTLMKEKTVDVRPSLLSSEENIKRQVAILDQLRDLIPPLTDDELVQLEQNILKHGVKDPLTIWETTALVAGLGSDESPVYVLVDGHNRYQIIQKHQLDYRINIGRFSTLDEVKQYMIDYQLGRRNLTPEQASYLRGMRYNQQKSLRGTNLLADTPQINVAETLAAEYGVSSRTIRRDGDFASGIEKLAPALKRDVLTGKQKLTKAVLNELAKGTTDDSIVHNDTFATNSDRSSGQFSTSTAQTNGRLDKLRADIRALANGNLAKRDCEKLHKKVGELLTLQMEVKQ